MAERPLLFFPRRSWSEPLSRPGRSSSIRFPIPSRQRDRLQPKLSALERAFEATRVSLQDDPAGLLPEQALVLETVGAVEDFLNAFNGLQGLEWVGEYDLEEIEPDEDFYDETDREAKIPGRLYLMLQNEQGLRELLSLWRIFSKNPEHPQFAEGRAKFGHLFLQLRDIRPWNHEDRLRETGLLEIWQERVREGRERMRVEVELWAHRNPGRRKKIENRLEELARRAGGMALARRDAVEAYAYHGMLLDLPIESVQKILENSDVDLVRCSEVMFFRPLGQIAVFPLTEEIQEEAPEIGATLPENEPIAALLDGLPLSNHQVLAGRLIVDDPDGWEESYPAAQRRHGTAMASLILHGELDTPGAPLRRPLYVRPVMKPRLEDSAEIIPEEVLPVDLLHRALNRMLQGEGREVRPTAPGIRIINHSLGDPWRPFDRFPSPWARLLDYFAAKHNLLFIVSAGNHPGDIELGVPRAERDALLVSPGRLRRETLRCLFQETRHRRLLAPGEAINVLTVGALSSDSSGQTNPLGTDLLDGAELPAPYSAHGLGFDRSVKPDILFPGGRLLYREKYGSSPHVVLEEIRTRRPPGQKVAAPGLAGELEQTQYTQGTSNAAALVTRIACQLHDLLLELRSGEDAQGPPDENLAILIRTMLVHGASWGGREQILQQDLGLSGRGPMARLLGYGVLDSSRALACTDQRVTLLGWGVIDPGRAYTYRVPLPASLNGSPVPRRLIATLSWFSPINPRRREYRRALLWLSYGNASSLLGLSRSEVDERQSRRGTLQHEIWEGNQATSYPEGESMVLQVNRRDEEGHFERPVPYGLAVTLEVAEGSALPIYEEIRAALQIRQLIQPRILS